MGYERREPKPFKNPFDSVQINEHVTQLTAGPVAVSEWLTVDPSKICTSRCVVIVCADPNIIPVASRVLRVLHYV